MSTTTKPVNRRLKLPCALLITLVFATNLAGCRSTARDEYIAARNIRIAPSQTADEPQGVAGVDAESIESPPR